LTVNKRKKQSRQRGSHTHGWGAKKKHRGKGHQGGAGMAGSGKRADSKKPSLWKERYFGKRGFIKKNIKLAIKPINASYIDEKINALTEKGLAEKGKDGYEINITKLGFNKLLGKGKVKNKLIITTFMASKKAVESVKNAGGEVITERAE
jgi:large subunit ribosomal protein L15